MLNLKSNFNLQGRHITLYLINTPINQTWHAGYSTIINHCFFLNNHDHTLPTYSCRTILNLSEKHNHNTARMRRHLYTFCRPRTHGRGWAGWGGTGGIPFFSFFFFVPLYQNEKKKNTWSRQKWNSYFKGFKETLWRGASQRLPLNLMYGHLDEELCIVCYSDLSIIG